MKEPDQNQGHIEHGQNTFYYFNKKGS